MKPVLVMFAVASLCLHEDPEGKTRTVKVRKSVDISGLVVGESVDAVLTGSVIIKVTR